MQKKIRAFASARNMLGNFNACVRPVWDGLFVFQRLQHFTTSKSSTGILWYATFDIAQSHKGFAKNCESHNVTSPLVTRVTQVFWRKCQSYNFTSTFYLEEWHAFCEVWVTWPNIALYLQCSLVNIWLSSSFETSRDSCEAHFPLEKETTSGRGWPYHMWIHCDLWTQDAVCMRKHDDREPEECGRVPATRILCEKHKECGSGRPRVISIYSNIERKTRFTWENTRNLEGLVRHAFSLKTWYGIREQLAASHVNLQSLWTQDAYYLRKHKGIVGVGTTRIFIEKQTSRQGWVIRAIQIYNQNEAQAYFFCRKQNDFSGVGGNDM